MNAPAGFRVIDAWPAVAPDDGEAIRAFWRREGAIVDDQVASQRLTQLVAHARSADGEVAGVCTVVPVVHPRFGQPMYYYRTFIGQAWRKTRVVQMLMNRATEILEAHARDNDYPCIGILLELENPRFGELGRMPVWPRPAFAYIGLSERGLETRAYFFKGAKLKPRPGAESGQ